MTHRIPTVSIAALALVALAPVAALAGDAAAGEEKYKLFCETCHGAAGKGDGPGAAGLPTPPRDFSVGEFKFDANGNGKPGEDEDLKMVVSQGAAAFGGSPLMTPWAGSLSEEDIDNVVAYIRTLKK